MVSSSFSWSNLNPIDKVTVSNEIIFGIRILFNFLDFDLRDQSRVLALKLEHRGSYLRGFGSMYFKKVLE
jgi:hypothetical protein